MRVEACRIISKNGVGLLAARDQSLRARGQHRHLRITRHDMPKLTTNTSKTFREEGANLGRRGK